MPQLPAPILDLAASSIELTRQICDIESVSGNEAGLADAIAASIQGTPLDIYWDGDAIVARTNLGREQRVGVAGHIDTVPVSGNLPTHLEGDELWGRGIVDKKGGVAVQLKLAAELKDPRYDIIWIWYDHKEVSEALNGLGRLARIRPDLLEGDFAVMGEPTNSIIEGGCNGNLRGEAVFRLAGQPV